ncbi:MAG: hypothetical protein V7K47_15940 [Nostoc sp.]
MTKKNAKIPFFTFLKGQDITDQESELISGGCQPPIVKPKPPKPTVILITIYDDYVGGSVVPIKLSAPG